MPEKTVNIRVDVKEAVGADINKGIARLDIKAMKTLGVNEGDYISITNKRTSGFIVAAAHQCDVDFPIVRIDGIGRRNIDAAIDEQVTVEPLIPKEAKSIEIAPAKKSIKISGKSMGLFFKRALLNKCVQNGDYIGLRGAKKTKEEEQGGFFDNLIGDMSDGTFFSSDIKFILVSTSPKGIVFISDNTKIIVSGEKSTSDEHKQLEVTYDDIGGMDTEIKRVREMIELPMRHPELFKKLGIDPPKGLLLHGPPGTGKTLLAKAVSSETNCHFTVINGPEILSSVYGGSEHNLRKIFKKAAQNAPSIIFIDELDAIAPSREESYGQTESRIVAQLLALMDGLKDRGNVIVIAATNRPNAIDPALRRPGRLDREIEIGVPDVNSREEILKVHIRNMPIKGVDIRKLAEITHGFVGADLQALCKESAMVVIREWAPKINMTDDAPIPEKILKKIVIKSEHFDESMKVVRPSAMREVMIDTPNIGWKDIGGLEEVKQELKEAVEWPLKYPDSFKRIGIRPPNGVLLYGPPGVGKTMLGKAVAKECKANFILVKGPEVFSKWVGESEKNIRKIFHRARQVSPAIIFFDELDSLGSERSSSSNVGNKVVNQLLTEIDGLEEIKGIVVIASTNRPDMIDPGLLRPGRFDRIIYTPIPDEEARKQILLIHLDKMSLAKDIDVAKLVEMTKGFVGADIEFFCIEAGMLALRENITTSKVEFKHFSAAIQKVFQSVNEDTENTYKDFEKYFRKQHTEEIEAELKKTMNYCG